MIADRYLLRSPAYRDRIVSPRFDARLTALGTTMLDHRRIALTLAWSVKYISNHPPRARAARKRFAGR